MLAMKYSCRCSRATLKRASETIVKGEKEWCWSAKLGRHLGGRRELLKDGVFDDYVIKTSVWSSVESHAFV